MRRTLDVAGNSGMAAEVLSVSDLQDLDDPHPFFAADRDDVDVSPGAVDVLAFLNSTQPRDLVPIACRELEVEAPGGHVHPFNQLLDHRLAPAFEEHRGMTHVLGVGTAADESYAWPAATLDLVLEARAGAIAKERIGALPDAEQLVDERYRLTHRARAGVGSE